MITPEEILKIIGNGHGVDWITKRYRGREVVEMRYRAMYLILQYTALSPAEVGALFARDRTTVLHGCKKVSNFYDIYIDYREEIDLLMHKVEERMRQQKDMLELKHRYMLDTDCA
jgi:chromosomal replication initiation ATPase DnaA